MNDLIIYLLRITNSLINCIEIFLEYIWYLPILGTNLGNIIFSLIIIMMALYLFEKWIYTNNSSTNKKNKNNDIDHSEEIESLKKARRERRNNK